MATEPQETVQELEVGAELVAVTALGDRVAVRVDEAGSGWAEVTCPDDSLSAGMPVTFRVPASDGVTFVQLVCEHSSGSHAHLRVGDVLRIDSERRVPRTPITAVVRSSDGRYELPADVRDVSIVGIRLEGTWVVDPGERLSLQLEAGAEPPIAMTVRVLRCDPTGLGRHEIAAEVSEVVPADWPRYELLCQRAQTAA